MSNFAYGWSVGHGGPGFLVTVYMFGTGGQVALGMTPSAAEAMATKLLMAAKAQREAGESSNKNDEVSEDD